MFGHLHIEERGRPSRIVDLVGSATIGRTSDNDIVLDSDGVSHVHAMLLAQASGVDLVDLGSTFGTFVNAVPAEPDEPVRLSDGAQIRIGRAALRFLAPRATTPMAPLVPGKATPPALAAPHLNTRLEGCSLDAPLEVGCRVSLLIWVGALIATDEHQSSRLLKLSSAHLEATTSLRVTVRAASPSWRIIAEQPTLLAARWGSPQIARYSIQPLRAERTRLGIRVEQIDSGHLVQHLALGVMADAAAPVRPPRYEHHVRSLGDVSSSPVPMCRACFAPTRAGAQFCHHCGAHL